MTTFHYAGSKTSSRLLIFSFGLYNYFLHVLIIYVISWTVDFAPRPTKISLFTLCSEVTWININKLVARHVRFSSQLTNVDFFNFQQHNLVYSIWWKIIRLASLIRLLKERWEIDELIVGNPRGQSRWGTRKKIDARSKDLFKKKTKSTERIADHFREGKKGTTMPIEFFFISKKKVG